jgi:hypothetical protein
MHLPHLDSKVPRGLVTHLPHLGSKRTLSRRNLPAEARLNPLQAIREIGRGSIEIVAK